MKKAQQQPDHMIIADGKIIHTGPGWQEAFLKAGLYSTYGTIFHLQGGIKGATLGPALHQLQQTPSERYEDGGEHSMNNHFPTKM